jgi:hypothetical protein
MEIISEEPRLDPFNIASILWQVTTSSKKSLDVFGIGPTLRTSLATLANVAGWWLARKRAPRFEPGVTMVTFTIHPDLARIWYWFVSRVADPSAKIVIVDCRGNLSPAYFPGARVARFCNFQHGRKIDYWVYHVFSTQYVWLSDDDVFPVTVGTWEQLRVRFEEDPLLAAVSLRARGWELEWQGKRQRCMGPYSLVFDRAKFCSERLSFRWVKTTNERIAPGRSPGRFDVADYAHFQLVLRGYRVEIVEERKVAGFVGVSRALMRTLETRGHVLQYICSQLADNPNHALGEIEAQYCAWLVHDLYTELFKEKPLFTPVVPREKLLELASRVSGSIWSDPVSRLTRWDEEYAVLLKFAEEIV